MDLKLLASSQRMVSALTLSAVVSLWQLFVRTDLDSDEFSQEATTPGAVERREERWGGVGLPGDPPVMNTGKVTAVHLIKSDGYIGHFVPTQSPQGESARSGQSVLHYHFQLPTR